MKPTHRLRVQNKRTGQNASVGAGWVNPNGTISIALNMCVRLVPHPDLTLTLHPIIEKENEIVKEENSPDYSTSEKE